MFDRSIFVNVSQVCFQDNARRPKYSCIASAFFERSFRRKSVEKQMKEERRYKNAKRFELVRK